MISTAPEPDDYARAVNLGALPPSRQRQLVAHVASRNRALADRPPVTPAVARCAAALLAAEPDRLASPTALAQAEALAAIPRLGDALMNLQEGTLTLVALSWPQDIAGVGPHRSAACLILKHLLAECTSLLQALERSDS